VAVFFAEVSDVRAGGLEECALPWFKVCFSGEEFSCAVSVEPRGGAAFGVLLVDGFSTVVKFEDVGEDGEAGLHLGRRVLQLVPVVDPVQHGMTDRAAGDPSGEATDRP
jgi:hypothetical protein